MNHDIVRDVMPWIMSAITLWMTFLQGRKTWTAWAWGLVNQVLWLLFILYTQTWGLLPLNAGLWWLYGRNLVQWYDDEHSLTKQRKAEIAPGPHNLYRHACPDWDDMVIDLGNMEANGCSCFTGDPLADALYEQAGRALDELNAQSERMKP